MVDYTKILQNLEFVNISTDEFTIFEWKPPRSLKSYILDLNIVKQNPVSNIFFHIFRGNMKIVHIRLKDLIYTVGSNTEIKYGNFSTTAFNPFKEDMNKIIRNFNSLDLVNEIMVPCRVCNIVLPITVKRSFIESSESYPVPLVYTHNGHAILCFIDKNYAVRGVELVNITG